MHHPDPVIAGLFDHEQDLDADRQAPDWGADELFTSTPRRRFRSERTRQREAAGHGTRAPRAEVAPRRRSGELVRESSTDGRVRDTPRPREAAVAESPPARSRRRPTEEEILGPPTDRAPSGRRTVTVTGRPDKATAPALARERQYERRRPAPSVDQRIGSRPDRVAGWACGLGFLLIVIAYATAGA